MIMYEDLENKAQDHAIWTLSDKADDKLAIESVRQMLAEAYKQGYKDANTFICYDRLCRDRMIVDELEEETD